MKRTFAALALAFLVACGGQVSCVNSGGTPEIPCVRPETQDPTQYRFCESGTGKAARSGNTTCYDEKGEVISRNGVKVER